MKRYLLLVYISLYIVIFPFISRRVNSFPEDRVFSNPCHVTRSRVRPGHVRNLNLMEETRWPPLKIVEPISSNIFKANLIKYFPYQHVVLCFLSIIIFYNPNTFLIIYYMVLDILSIVYPIVIPLHLQGLNCSRKA